MSKWEERMRASWTYPGCSAETGEKLRALDMTLERAKYAGRGNLEGYGLSEDEINEVIEPWEPWEYGDMQPRDSLIEFVTGNMRALWDEICKSLTGDGLLFKVAPDGRLVITIWLVEREDTREDADQAYRKVRVDLAKVLGWVPEDSSLAGLDTLIAGLQKLREERSGDFDVDPPHV